MTWKKFFRFEWKKVVIVIAFLSVSQAIGNYCFYLTTQGTYCQQVIPQPFFSLIHILFGGWISSLLGFQVISGVIYGGHIAMFLFITNMLYWYFLSCILVSFFDKLERFILLKIEEKRRKEEGYY